jgi:hypothetical protein
VAHFAKWALLLLPISLAGAFGLSALWRWIGIDRRPGVLAWWLGSWLFVVVLFLAPLAVGLPPAAVIVSFTVLAFAGSVGVGLYLRRTR